MSLGILQSIGLGINSTIPGECWDQPGFKDCQAIQYKAAKIVCASQNKDNDACVVPLTDQYAMSACGCKKKPKASSSSTVMVTSDLDTLAPSEPTFLGFSLKTVATVAIVGVGLYVYNQKPKKKG